MNLDNFKKKFIQLWPLLLVISTVCVLFLLSSQTGGVSNGYSTRVVIYINNLFGISGDGGMWWTTFLVRKTAHVSIFFCLTLILFVTINHYHKKRRFRSKLIVSGALSFAMAIFDEIHQIYVPGRSAQILDIGIDLIGISCAVLLISCCWHKIDKE
ncbi:MAG: VanZ family protein [Candidatus Pacebacteria bacterium]|nr:VanZ family protein [Candidatus Paceibacterota bacterium]